MLLDDVADYFGRGWCTYEAAVAYGYLSSSLDVWSGGQGLAVHRDHQESAFRLVLNDRPHLLWRAILDTELFGVQAGAECMARLGLATTRPEDLGIVYDLLRGLGMPQLIHYDDGEVLTGVFPMPVVNGKAAVRSESGRRVARAREAEEREIEMPVVTAGIPVSRAWRLAGLERLRRPGPGTRTRCSPTQRARRDRSGVAKARPSCSPHWIREDRGALQEALKARIVSLSWLASDVAPVGYLRGQCAVNPASARRQLGRRCYGRQPVCRDRHPAPDRDALELGDRPRGTGGWCKQGPRLQVFSKAEMAAPADQSGVNELLLFNAGRSQAAVEWRGAFPSRS